MPVISLPLRSCCIGVLAPGCISVLLNLLDVTFLCIFSSASLQLIFRVSCTICNCSIGMSVGGGGLRILLLPPVF